MILRPYVSVGNLSRQFAAALVLRRRTGWRFFFPWLTSGALRSIPVAGGAVGMGCVGYGYHPVWEVTEACNLSCQHCHALSGRAGPDELNTVEGRRLISQVAAARKFQMLVYSGGEPLVRPDLDELLRCSYRAGLVNVIATNGTLIDGPRARELHRRCVRGLAVSFDSTEEGIHNQIRRSPRAFELALRGIEAAKAAGMVVQLNFTAMAKNLHTLPEVARFAHEIRADILLCYQLVPMGRGNQIASDALTSEQSKELVQTVARLQRDTFTIIEPVAAPQYWPHLLGSDDNTGDGNGGIVAAPIRSRAFHGCAAGWGLVYIKPNGDVWPCPFVPVSGGNVRQRSLGEIWEQSEIFTALRDRDRLHGKCGACRNREICGGCRGKAYATTGDYLDEDPTCWMGRI